MIRRLCSFVLAAALFFCFSVPALAVDDVPVGVSDVPMLMSLDSPSVMAVSAASGVTSPATISYLYSGSDWTSYPGYWQTVSLSASNPINLNIRFNGFSDSLIDSETYLYVANLRFLTPADLLISSGSRYCSVVESSGSYFFYIQAPGSVLKNNSFTFVVRGELSALGYTGSGSASLSGSASAIGQGSVSAGGGSIQGSVLEPSGLMTGSLYNFTGYLNSPDYSLSGASVSLSGSRFDPFSKTLPAAISFTIYSADICLVEDLVDRPFLVHDFSSFAAFLAGQQAKDDQDMEDSYNSEVDQQISEADQILSDMETFEEDIFQKADQAIINVDPNNASVPLTVLNSVAWISSIWTSLFGQMGDFKAVITFPLYVALALLVIGRGQRIMRDHFSD